MKDKKKGRRNQILLLFSSSYGVKALFASARQGATKKDVGRDLFFVRAKCDTFSADIC